MPTRLEIPLHIDEWLPARLEGTLGSACDRDLDAHLLVCDTCLAQLIAHAVEAVEPAAAAVPA